MVSYNLMPEVDWTNYSKAFTGISFAQQQHIVKLSLGHTPIATIMQCWHKQNHSRCPGCGAENEDIQHVIFCPHKSTQLA